MGDGDNVDDENGPGDKSYQRCCFRGGDRDPVGYACYEETFDSTDAFHGTGESALRRPPTRNEPRKRTLTDGTVVK